MLQIRSNQIICLGAALLLGVGAAHAEINDSKRVSAESEQQTNFPKLSSDTNSNPRYQFSRKDADYAAMFPVTRHQADALKLRNVAADGNRDTGAKSQS